jgi:hypothetical protein
MLHQVAIRSKGDNVCKVCRLAMDHAQYSRNTSHGCLPHLLFLLLPFLFLLTVH